MQEGQKLPQEQDFEGVKITIKPLTLICSWKSRTSFRNNLKGGAGGAVEDEMQNISFN